VVYLVLACRGLAAIVFGVSAFSKLRNRPAFRAFRLWLAALPVPLARSRPGPVAAVMAAAESAIVVLVVLPWTARAGLALAAAVLAVFTAGTWLAVARGTEQSCQCFGASVSPLAWEHVAVDALLCAAMIAAASVAQAGLVRPVGIVAALAAGVAISLWVVFLPDLTALLRGTDDHSPGLAPHH
jgi:hypothetical protein